MTSPARSVHRIFETLARQAPRRTCVETSERRFDYGEIDAAATSLAGRLAARGVGDDDESVVGLLMDASVEALVSILAIWKAGGAYLPLDPNGPTKRMASMIRQAGVRLVLTKKGVSTAKSDALRAASGLDTGGIVEVDANESVEATSFRSKAPSSERLAYVFFTSGSTGTPKGVMVEHRQVLSCIDWMQRAFPLDASSSVLQRTPLTFDPSVWEMFWPATTGASFRIVPPGKATNPAYLVKLLSQGAGATAMYVPASMLGAMNQVLSRSDAPRQLSLPLLFIGAEAIHRSVIDSFYEFFDGRIVNTYGPTECAINNTFYEVPKAPRRTPVPIGRPIDGNTIYLVSPRGDLARPGEPGEIFIGGSSVARGYIGEPEKTARAFVKTEFAEGILYRTGDIGRLADDGNIEFLGRVDDQVKIRGHRIEPGEIETALSSHPGVDRAVVLAEATPPTSAAPDGERRLVAFYSAREPVSELALRQHLTEFIAPHMIPSVFVNVEEFPLTAHGKIDKPALASRRAELPPARNEPSGA